MGMTPAERLITAANCQEPDCVPVALIDLTPVYFRKWALASGREFGKDVGSRIRAQLDFFQQWPEVVPLIDAPTEMTIGLRAWLNRGQTKAKITPASQHVSRKFLTKQLKRAKVPDPHGDERMSKVLNDWQRHIDHLPPEARRKYGGLVWSFKVPSPLSSVGWLLSYPEVFRLVYEDPEFLRELLDFHTRSAVMWVQAVEQLFIQSGLTPPRFFDDEILPMLSPDHVKEFCLPYMNRIYTTSRSPIKIFHCDNRVTRMPDLITSLGANVFFGNFSDYGALKEHFGNKIALMGNVPSLSILTQGSRSDVEECCKWLIARCGPGGGFILSTGGGADFFGETPFENVNAMVRAAEKYGHYPLAISADICPTRYKAVISLHFSTRAAESKRQEELHLDSIAEQTCLGNMLRVQETVTEALDTGISPKRIFLDGLCQGLVRATDLFYQERYFHPEMERADKAFQAGITALGSSFKPEYFKGTVVIGSLSIHESGTRLIEIMLRGGGFKVINLGIVIDTEKIIEEAIKAKAHVIAMGVYFYRYGKRAEQVTHRLRKRGSTIKTLVGGMGITPQMAKELDVDAYASDGQEAREKALALLGY